MNIVYKREESTVMPELLEIQKTVVYLRKDVVEDVRTDEFENSTTYYVYQEAKMTHEEFNKYSSFVAAKNAINGTEDSNNILHLISGQENGDNNQLIIMEAIADLYDAIASMM